MSISLPNNKEEKRQRLIMLVKQGSITQQQADTAYNDYCALFAKTLELQYITWYEKNKKEFA